MKYRVMIVDDEPIVCEGLRTFSWDRYECEIAAEAMDGAEALELAETVRPDIIISDIRMPEMDGIEFSQRIKALDLECEIILLTGYADFAYAQQALKIGVHDYLLKPFSFEDIEKALTGCIAAIADRNRKIEAENHIREQLDTMVPFLTKQVYQDLLDGNTTADTDKIAVCRIRSSKYVVFSTQSDVEGKESYNLALYSLLSEAVKGMDREFYLARGADIISCVLCFKEERTDKFCTQAAFHFCRMFQEMVKQRFGFSISMGISMVSKDIFQLNQLKKQSVRALNYRYTLGNCFIMIYSDIANGEPQKTADLSVYQKNLQKSLLKNDRDGMEMWYRELIKALADASAGDFNFVKKKMLELIFQLVHFAENALPGGSRDVPYQEIEALMKCESLEAFSAHGLLLLKQMVQGEPTAINNCITDKVMAYIEENLDKELSLDILSGQLNYSTAYLSRLIKKYSGKNFMELLLDCRMGRAKELLKNTDLKVSQIAGKVGYNDNSYFIQTFKKKAGVTPNEYRALYALERNWE